MHSIHTRRRRLDPAQGRARRKRHDVHRHGYGEGIAPEHLPRIFEKFYRVPGSRSRIGGGAGLGLAIAREIVAAHGGQISAASEPGKGTTFTFTLPVNPEATDVSMERQHRMNDSQDILIVDDEPNVRLVFRTALESAGYRTSRPVTAKWPSS